MESDQEAKRLVATLTNCQKEVACLLAEGLTEPQVAERLCRSPNTVDRHVQEIHRRLGCRRRAQLVAIVLRAGLCDPARK